MYRLLIETLLGVNLEGDQLRLSPRLPKTWNTYKIHYRYRQTVYHITITRLAPWNNESETQPDDPAFYSTGRAADSAGTKLLTLDGQEISGTTIPLRNDGLEHSVEMYVPAHSLKSNGPNAARHRTANLTPALNHSDA